MNEGDAAIPSGVQSAATAARVFLGVKIATEISDELVWLAKELRGEHVRLVAPGDVHLTLVAPWNETSITEAIEKIRMTVSGFSPFTLEVKHLNYGPDPKRPRLLWAECGTPDEITRLRDALLGLFNQSDDRPFRPHITLARLRGNGAKIARRRPIDRELSFAQHITSVELFRSPPSGATGYQILASAPLLAHAFPASGGQSGAR